MKDFPGNSTDSDIDGSCLSWELAAGFILYCIVHNRQMSMWIRRNGISASRDVDGCLFLTVNG